MFPTKKLIARMGAVLALMLGLSAAAAGPSAAQDPAPTPADAVSYFNPDTGKATENPDVDPNSGCGDEEGEAPDKDDTQPVVTDPMTDNVHTDACLFDDAGARIDVQAAFQVSGVGSASACPDPDGMDVEGMEADDKSATLSNGDTLCVLSGYEDANEEYHVRTVSDEPGTQTITFCADPEGNGCDDAELTSTTTVTWTDDAGNGEVPQGGVDTGLAPPSVRATDPRPGRTCPSRPPRCWPVPPCCPGLWVAGPGPEPHRSPPHRCARGRRPRGGGRGRGGPPPG